MARQRSLRTIIATIRPLIDQAGSADVFGDAPVLVSANRAAGFNVRVAVSWTRNDFDSAIPGRELKSSATATLWKKDLPGSNKDYVPGQNDLWELLTGKLFVVASQPTGYLPPSLGLPMGGWRGWRVSLSDQTPDQRAAGTYD